MYGLKPVPFTEARTLHRRKFLRGVWKCLEAMEICDLGYEGCIQ
jgi:hypothetical protein